MVRPKVNGHKDLSTLCVKTVKRLEDFRAGSMLISNRYNPKAATVIMLIDGYEDLVNTKTTMRWVYINVEGLERSFEKSLETRFSSPRKMVYGTAMAWMREIITCSESGRDAWKCSMMWQIISESDE